MNPTAAYLYYKEQIERNINGQEPVHSVLSVETRIKYPDPSKVKAYDEEIIGKTKNGFSSVIFMRATGNIGGNMKDSEESIKTYRSDFGNAITKRLAALHAYLKGFVPTALSEEEHGKFLGLMKTYEIKAKKIQSKVSFDVDNMLLISSEINSEALSKFKNDKEKASKFLKEISIVTEYFIPIVDGKRLNVSKVANLAKSRHETDRKKTIPIGPVSTNYDKSQMAGLAEKTNYKRGPIMKKSELIKIIKEELKSALTEDPFANLDAALEKPSVVEFTKQQAIEYLREYVKATGKRQRGSLTDKYNITQIKRLTNRKTGEKGYRVNGIIVMDKEIK
jgi:hypothetical protein